MSWASRKRTTTVSASTSIPAAQSSAETENISSGGCALTDATDDAVSATGLRPASVVIKATPPGRPRKSALKSSAGAATAPPLRF